MPLHEQLSGCVRRALLDGSLQPGEGLPPARELAMVVDVHANTVLQAYRALRAEGLLEFRRGRGVRVTSVAVDTAAVTGLARELVVTARRCGLSQGELVSMVTGLSESMQV